MRKGLIAQLVRQNAPFKEIRRSSWVWGVFHLALCWQSSFWFGSDSGGGISILSGIRTKTHLEAKEGGREGRQANLSPPYCLFKASLESCQVLDKYALRFLICKLVKSSIRFCVHYFLFNRVCTLHWPCLWSIISKQQPNSPYSVGAVLADACRHLSN